MEERDRSLLLQHKLQAVLQTSFCFYDLLLCVQAHVVKRLWMLHKDRILD